MSGTISASTIGTAVVGALASQAVMQAVAPKGGGGVSLPGVQAPPQSQAAKTPDQQAARSNTAASPGAIGTMLTGLAGVDPNSLALGKNKLLGS